MLHRQYCLKCYSSVLMHNTTSYILIAYIAPEMSTAVINSKRRKFVIYVVCGECVVKSALYDHPMRTIYMALRSSRPTVRQKKTFVTDGYFFRLEFQYNTV